MDTFRSIKEFYFRFPSKIYKCCWCGRITTNPYICIQCGKQANALIANTYRYKIGSDEPKQIFIPLEKLNCIADSISDTKGKE